MAWDRCNQDSVWREIEVSTTNSRRFSGPGNGILQTITGRRAGVLSGNALSARGAPAASGCEDTREFTGNSREYGFRRT